MKISTRISLLLFLVPATLTSFHATGQSFVLTDMNHVTINNGDTIVVTGPDSMMLETGIIVENTSAAAKTVKVQRIDLSVVQGAESFIMWGFWEYTPSVVLTPIGVSISSGTADSSFMSGYMSFGVPGTSWYQFIFFDENNPSDSALAVIQYNATGPAGINENALHAASLYPNPGNGNFNVSFPSPSKQDLLAEVYNSNGDLIMKRFVETNSALFSVDIRNFSPGIYFLKITDRDNTVYNVWKMVKM